MQRKSKEWYEEFKLFSCNELFLFKDWIYPFTLEDFHGKDVLECGCGGGQHTSFIASYAKSVTAVDLNTIEIAKERNKNSNNINCVENDTANMRLGKVFDIFFNRRHSS